MTDAHERFNAAAAALAPALAEILSKTKVDDVATMKAQNEALVAQNADFQAKLTNLQSEYDTTLNSVADWAENLLSQVQAVLNPPAGA
jgi:uncharacterized protein YlxW (UPF0749 family)